MVLFKNADVTIYNRYFDKTLGIDKYQRTVIEGVNWQSKRNATVSNKGVNVADTSLIFIDKLDNYISPKQFAKLSDVDRVNYFTFGIGDKIVKGNVNFQAIKIVDLDKNFDNVVTLVAVRELSGHWEVEAK